MTIIWKSTSEQIDQVRVREPREMSLSLKPSEFEALLAWMLSCSTRRATPNEPRPSRTRCTRIPVSVRSVSEKASACAYA